MGNPPKGTKAYARKLEQTRVAKQSLADAKFGKTPKGRRLQCKLRKGFLAKLHNTNRELKQEAAQLQTKALKANTYYRELVPLRSRVALFEAQLKKERQAFRSERAQLREHTEELQTKLKKTTTQLNRWLLFCGLVEAHSRPGLFFL